MERKNRQEPLKTVAAGSANERGFTLIELSIVLVIIGLIVGGILVGQDMIKAAEIRSTIGQVEKYNSAVNTFRSKYNAIPGDMTTAQSTAYGFFTETTLGGSAGHQDGNGLIEGGSAGATTGLGETLEFWVHLSEANLIDGQQGIIGNSVLVVTSGATTGTVTTPSQSLEPTKTTPVNYFTVYANGGYNFFQIAPIATIPTSGVYTFGTVGLTPQQAYNMDLKVDDGLPQTGTVQSRAITGTLNAPASSAATSTNSICDIGSGAATDTYNLVTTTGGTDGSCSVRFRFN